MDMDFTKSIVKEGNKKYYIIQGKALYRHERRLFDCITTLHQSMTGTAEPPVEDTLRDYAFLKCRLVDWEPGYRSDLVAVESTIRALCEIITAQYEQTRLKNDEDIAAEAAAHEAIRRSRP